MPKPSAQRVIFRCSNRACGHIWARDYPHANPYGGFSRDPEPGERFRQSTGDDANKPCPRCGTLLPRRAYVKGHYNPGHRCDARCENAVGPSCDCQCGGANHGRGHLAA